MERVKSTEISETEFLTLQVYTPQSMLSTCRMVKLMDFLVIVVMI